MTTPEELKAMDDAYVAYNRESLVNVIFPKLRPLFVALGLSQNSDQALRDELAHMSLPLLEAIDRALDIAFGKPSDGGL